MRYWRDESDKWSSLSCSIIYGMRAKPNFEFPRHFRKSGLWTFPRFYGVKKENRFLSFETVIFIYFSVISDKVTKQYRLLKMWLLAWSCKWHTLIACNKDLLSTTNNAGSILTHHIFHYTLDDVLYMILMTKRVIVIHSSIYIRGRTDYFEQSRDYIISRSQNR